MIGKPNNLKVFGSNEPKGHEQVAKNQLRSPMPNKTMRVPKH